MIARLFLGFGSGLRFGARFAVAAAFAFLLAALVFGPAIAIANGAMDPLAWSDASRWIFATVYVVLLLVLTVIISSAAFAIRDDELWSEGENEDVATPVTSFAGLLEACRELQESQAELLEKARAL